MKNKIVSIVLAVLVIGLVLPGCVSSSEYNELKVQVAEKKVQIQRQNVTIKEQTNQIKDLCDQITKIEQEKADLEALVEHLEEPTPAPAAVSVDVVGFISFDETIEVQEKFFPKAAKQTAYFTKGPHPLVSIETLKEFLAYDSTNKYPPCYPCPYNACDELAFRLKAHWIEAGLPPGSLGLAKIEKKEKGMMLRWRNIFLTKENGEFVFYDINLHTGEIVKIGKPSEVYRVTMIAGKL